MASGPHTKTNTTNAYTVSHTEDAEIKIHNPESTHLPAFSQTTIQKFEERPEGLHTVPTG